MLNRRSLRVKAMQTLFAYHQCTDANSNLGLEEIDEEFSPDLNSMDAPDHDKLKSDIEQAKKIYSSNLTGIALEDDTPVSIEAQNKANAVFELFNKRCRDDFDHLSKQMVNDAQALVDRFLEVISLLISWSDYSKVEADKKRKLTPERLFVGDYNFSKNKVVQFFRDSSKVQVALIKKDITWENDEDNVKNWFKEIIKKDELFAEYRRIAEPTFDKDKELIDHLIKQIIFKNEQILPFFESKDIFWIEDKAIVRSLVTRSIRDLEHDSSPKEFDVPDFSNNWEEDKEFFEQIFKLTVEKSKEYSDMIANKTKNWDVERLAITDQIILKMAITEMLNFTSIPLKVTINEYIELSKNYSTPKSKQFVNGVLDVISNELQTEGRVKKSGRGLMDNK